VWLFENSPIKDFNSAVKDFVKDENIKAVATAMVKGFEAKDNWKAFEAFLNILFAKTDQPVETAKSIGGGFESGSQWSRNYFNYCLNKPKLTEYAFRDKVELADKNISMNKTDEAAEIYREIIGKCGPNQDKSVLELKLCQCFISAGKYEQAVSDLDKLIANYKASSRENVKRAILMKGQCYIQMGQLDKAADTFLSIVVEYPDAPEAPEANFFVGYSKMLAGKFDDAKGIFNSLIHDFPPSAFVSKAKQCLERIERLAK
jgi:TolA-binding protein